MILATLLILMFAGGLGVMFALIVLVIGYRDMARRATQAANMNAGYWAQAQERTALVEAYNERMSDHLTENQKLLAKMTDHARDALKIAMRSGTDPPDPRLQRIWVNDELVYDADDSILNAREIDG